MITELDQNMISRAVYASMKSVCMSHRVGAVIYSPDVGEYGLVVHGYNQTPGASVESCNEFCHRNGMILDDGSLSPAHRDAHSAWSLENELHAEMVAIMKMHQGGIPLEGCTLYATHSPCVNCLKHILFYASQKGIIRMVYINKYDRSPVDWEQKLIAAGVAVEKIKLDAL